MSCHVADDRPLQPGHDVVPPDAVADGVILCVETVAVQVREVDATQKGDGSRDDETPGA